MKIKDLEMKAEKIDELNIYRSNNYSDIYYYEIYTANEDVKKHLQDVLQNIELEDALYLPGTDAWIKKEIIVDAINIIKNADKYEDISFSSMQNIPFVRRVSYSHQQDMTISVHIYFFTSDEYAMAIRDVMAALLYDTDYITAKGYNYGLHITNKNIDEKEKCKHTCKTQYKINKINEIFEL